jgi:Odorant response abnormal 4-like
MPRHSVQVDAAALESVVATAGVLLGLARGANTTAVLCALPTPPAPPGASPLSWAALHARAVARLAPGGLRVVGVCAPAAAADRSALAERAAAVESDAGRPMVVVTCDAKGAPSASVVSHGMRSAASSTTQADLLVVDGLVASTCVVSTTLPLDSLPSVAASAENETSAATEMRCIDSAVKYISSFLAIHAPPAIYVSSTADQRLLPTTKTNLTVAVLLPAVPSLCTPTASHIHLRGTLRICAVIAEDATLGEVLASLRADAAASLDTRAELLREMDAESELPPRDAGDRSLPARVMIRPVATGVGVTLCDYVSAGETIDDDVVERVGELLSWTGKDDAARFSFELVERVVDSECSATTVPNDSSKAAPDISLNASHVFDSSYGIACWLTGAAVVVAFGVAFQSSYAPWR